jgi:glutathione S-transferase
MKVYFAPRSRAMRVRWLIEELEVPHELVRLESAKLRDFPALVDGDVTLFEASAICLIHLADRFPDKHLAPLPGSADRGAYYQWMSFAEGTLEPEVMGFHARAQLAEEQRASHHEEIARAHARLDGALAVLDARLADRDVLVGAQFTAVDLLTAAILHMAFNLKLLEGHPRLVEFVIRHTQRPSCRKAVS